MENIMRKKLVIIACYVALGFGSVSANAWNANDFNTIVGGNKAVTGSNLKPSQYRKRALVADKEVNRLMVDLGLSGGKFVAFAGEDTSNPVVRKRKSVYQAKRRAKRTSANSHLQFANASYQLDSRALAKVDALARTYQIAKGEIKQISINGYTNSVGSDRDNMLLSHNRASIVRAALVRKGVPANLVRFHGFGETKPMRGINPAAPQNRRVEYEVLKK